MRRETRILLLALCIGITANVTFANDASPVYPDKYDLLTVMDERGRRRPVETIGDWEIRRRHILANVQLVTGPLPARDDLPPLDVQVIEEVDQGDYIQKKLTYVAESDGERVPAYLLVPKERAPGNPAMVCLHQTAHDGKAEPAGLIPPPRGYPDMYYAQELARRGFITLAPDYPGFSREYKIEPQARDIYMRGYSSVTMKGVWNHMRAVDLLLAMPEVDPRRIGVIGHSLGGHNAVFLALFDERVKICIESSGVIPWESYERIIQFAHPNYYMPLIGCRFGHEPARMPWDWVEALAAIAPRGLFIYEDGATARIPAMVDSVAQIYQRFGVPQRFMAVTESHGHSFLPQTRQRAYAFLDRFDPEAKVVARHERESAALPPEPGRPLVARTPPPSPEPFRLLKPGARTIIAYVEPGDPLRPPVDSELDGAVYGSNVQPELRRSYMGRVNGTVAWTVTKFPLGRFLPPGTAADDIESVTLRIPVPDDPGYAEGDPFTATQMVLHHFATTDNDTISQADYHDPEPPYRGTPALRDYGVVIPRHRPRPDPDRFVGVDVTDSVRDDIVQGRSVSAFRVGADPAGDLDGRNFVRIPNSDLIAIPHLLCANQDPEAQNVMKLVIRLNKRRGQP